jgi:hypothetical protein
VTNQALVVAQCRCAHLQDRFCAGRIVPEHLRSLRTSRLGRQSSWSNAASRSSSASSIVSGSAAFWGNLRHDDGRRFRDLGDMLCVKEALRRVRLRVAVECLPPSSDQTRRSWSHANLHPPDERRDHDPADA